MDSPPETGHQHTWLTSLSNVSDPPSPITNTQRKYATAPAIALADRTWLLDIGNPALLIADLRDLVSQVYYYPVPGGESVVTSLRVQHRHAQLTQEGNSDSRFASTI